MKIPRYIKEAIIKARKHYALANKNNSIVRDWLVENNLIDENKGNGKNGFDLDSYIDIIEFGQGEAEEIINGLESLNMENQEEFNLLKGVLEE